MTWNASLGTRAPAHAPGAGRRGRPRPARVPDVGLPRQGARRRAAGRGHAARPREELPLSVGRRGQRERREDGAPRSPGGRRSSRARAATTARRWRCCRCRAIRAASRSSRGCRAWCAWPTRTASAARSARSRRAAHHECAEDLETALLREGPETVAAVILEGIVGANGVFVPPAGYWKKIRAICDRHGVLLIADEVLSGFGRTGRWFAVDHDGVTPDLMTMAKGIDGRLRAGRRGHRHRAHRPPLRRPTCSVCGLTSYAHPLTCAAIVAAIETLPRRGPGRARGARSATRLGPRLAAFAAHAPVHRRGARHRPAVGVRAVRAGDPHPPALAATHGKARGARCARHHLHMHKRDNLLYFAPPLVITRRRAGRGAGRAGRGARRGAAA